METPRRRPVLNALTQGLETDAGDPPGFLVRFAKLTDRLDATWIGATLYELDPGERANPYHYEYGNEEALLVLNGQPTLRHPGGRDVLQTGDLVGFPDGPDGAHQLINESGGAVRFLILSTRQRPYVAVYPDSGKVGVDPPGGMFRLADAVPYWEGERA